MTDDPNARPSLSERYGVAVGNGAGMEHMILAAGMQHERLGAILLRLQSEYDAVRGELERAGQIATTAAERLRGVVREADRLKALAARLDASRSSTFGEADEARLRAAALVTEAAAIKLRTPAEVMTARAVILMSLPALQAAKHELAALAVRMGANPKRALAPAVALQLAGRVLDVWLDETCHRLNVSLLAYSPLGFGLLTGKYDASGIEGPGTPQGARIASYESVRKQRWGRPEALAAARRYNQLAREHGLTPTQLALAFCYTNWRVASTIIGVRTLEQLDQNLDAWGTTLSPELLAQIDAIRWEIRDPAV